MGSELIASLMSKVLENSLLFGLLVFIGLVLWKRYVQHIEKTEKKLEIYEIKLDEYMNVDKEKIQTLVQENTEAFRENTLAFRKFTETNDKTNYLLNCFIKDMQEFKKSDTYQQYKKEKTNNK